MVEWQHGFKIDRDKCTGRMTCMRACPTQAIRIKEGKAELLPELCIDCGSCLRVCPTGAISAATRSLKEVSKFKYKVVVPSAVLFGQFPPSISPLHIVEGLKTMGFDEVWVMAKEIELVNLAIRNYMENWKGRLPLISSSCPAIVRLVQVSYPGMVEQLVHVETPRELAGRELKRKYSKELGIPKEVIAAIYVTSCQAKTISILEPAEGVRSELDGAIGIADVYNGILSAYQSHKETNNDNQLSRDLLRSGEMLQWGMSEGQRQNLKDYSYMSLTGLSNIIHVFDDIEKGKLRNLDFLECFSCWGGCVNGNLTVDNLYVARSKLQRLLAEIQEKAPPFGKEVREHLNLESLHPRGPIRPRPIRGDRGNMKERITRIKDAEAVLASLPGLNCGLCGTPSCKTLSGDIVFGDAKKTDCIFYSKDRLEKLRALYLKNNK